MKKVINSIESAIVLASCFYVFCVGGDAKLLWLVAAAMCLVPPLFMLGSYVGQVVSKSNVHVGHTYQIEEAISAMIGKRAAWLLMIAIPFSVSAFCVYVYMFWEFKNFSGMAYPKG